jgi:SAM-dependent methyltransferase
MGKTNIAIYHEKATSFFNLYESLKFENVHADWLSLLPNGGYALDIGAGSGRDAAKLAVRGFYVFAVEPASALLTLAQCAYTTANIRWFKDQLPLLATVPKSQTFDLILLSAVWMHLTPQEQTASWPQLIKHLRPDGLLVFTLRAGEFKDGRSSYTVDPQQLSESAHSNGLRLVKSSTNFDKLNRENITWQTLVFTSATVEARNIYPSSLDYRTTDSGATITDNRACG